MNTTFITSNRSTSLLNTTNGYDVTLVKRYCADENNSVCIEYNQNGDLDNGLFFAARLFRKKNLERTFPILKWGRNYTVQKAISDLIAGLTVGLTVLPQALGNATVAGLPPIYGLYSSFAGCFVYILFGSTKAITIGPTTIQSILTFKYTYGKPPEYAVFLCFVTAVVTSAMGILRLGFIANFISAPVISGFTSAIAITIVSTQLKSSLGISFNEEGFLPTVLGVIEHFHERKLPDVILSITALTTYLILQYIQNIVGLFVKVNKPVDKALWLLSTARSAIIIVAATAYVMITNTTEFSLVGHITPGLPAFKPPPFTIFDTNTNTTHYLTDILQEEASALIVLPLLGVMGHITIAKAFAGSDRVDYSQEILSIGISNAISCFFSSYSIGGSFSRTTVNAMSGAESPAGGLATGVMVILALQYLTPTFAFIPKASLAAIISGSVLFMVDLKIVMPLWRSKRMDLVPWLLTFLVTLFVGLEFGIMTGLIISVLYLLYYAARPRVKIMQKETCKRTKFVIIVLDRSMTFPSVDHITYKITKAVNRLGNKEIPVVIDCRYIQYADYTAGEAIRDMIKNLKLEGHELVFWQLKPSILHVLKGVMYNTGIALVHCQFESDVEKIVDTASQGQVNAFLSILVPRIWIPTIQSTMSKSNLYNVPYQK